LNKFSIVYFCVAGHFPQDILQTVDRQPIPVMKKKPEAKPPKFYTDFIEKYPEVGHYYEKMGAAVHKLGPLNERECALIKLAISGGHQFQSALKAHVRKALKAGISRGEMEHVALLLLPTLGLPTMMSMLGIIGTQMETHNPGKETTS
jgi:alkylhydroperoxidase/carboxymuconolactone decarboxylase family protein YurZ